MKKSLFHTSICVGICLLCFCSFNSSAQSKTNAIADTIKKPASTDTTADVPTIPNITFLNAANFDFSGKLSASYMGIFKVFAPNINQSSWGFIAGIERISYSQGNINGNDSSQTEYFTQNFLLNPIDHLTYNSQTGTYTNYIQQGAKYVQQFNQYNYTTSNKVWSFYAEPMWRKSQLGTTDNVQGLYFHLHAELLVNQWTRNVSIKYLHQNPDTLTVTSPHQSQQGFYWVTVNPIVSNYNFLSGYFGAGATIYIDPINNNTNYHLFSQATFGLAINTPNFQALNNPQLAPAPNGTYPSNDVTNSAAKGFYLIRTSFIASMSKSSQLVLGIIIRGNFPAETPQYAVFVGLNLDLGAIVKLIAPGV
jgi:hypothetical protein